MPTGSLYCDYKLALRLEQYASEIGRPTSAIINDLLEAFLNRVDQIREVEERTKRYEEIADQLMRLRHGPGSRA